MTRKPWGVYRKNAGDAPFHVCFCAFAGEDDGVLVETFPTRPEAKESSSERNRIAKLEADIAAGQRRLFE